MSSVLCNYIRVELSTICISFMVFNVSDKVMMCYDSRYDRCSNLIKYEWGLPRSDFQKHFFVLKVCTV